MATAPNTDIWSRTIATVRDAGPWGFAIAAIVLVAVVQGIAGEAAASLASAAVAAAAWTSLQEETPAGRRGRGLVVLAAAAGLSVAIGLTSIRDAAGGAGDERTRALDAGHDGVRRPVRVDLRFGDLVGADLQKAVLRHADLSYVVLTGADLSGADLRDTCLRRAVLTGAVLDGANLDGADTTGVVVDPAEAEDALNYPTDQERARSTACD